ncbi:Uncharacterised protein [Legionella steigerwaltii]|uniref:Uncharacterized protein n=1 Tax=Legionella steigerwaltii TaxID=460 RepID=A0A378LBW1_9GAMM|nr:hypothetical protein [Legionella steigerwaltii]KTD81083.1 hypothetical protein Lstg_0310 [Legionella steigerwaltii]STY23229.1 Uncharacterised protein [Legionella steigerwaltii]
MSFGKNIFSLFKTKPQGITQLASEIEHNIPYYRIHGGCPEKGLPTRGNFDRVTIEALARYISTNKPLVAYGGTILLENLFTGFLKDKKIENGKSGLIVGIPERVIELSSLYEPLCDYFIGLNQEEATNAVADFIKKNEAIIENLTEDRIVAFVTNLEGLVEGEPVRNLFANFNPALPQELTIHELQDTDFIHELWDEISSKGSFRREK